MLSAVSWQVYGTRGKWLEAAIGNKTTLSKISTAIACTSPAK